MKIIDVRQFFGTAYNFSKKTGMHHSCLLNWEKQGFVPIKTQLFLEKFTDGGLKAALDDLGEQDD